MDKVETWMSRGAQPSDTVARLMKKAGWKPSTARAKAPDAAAEG
jgi:ribosomal protein S16